MAGTKEIKRRIKSVKNTKKITKAMELVAASKMRRAVAQALSSRLYASYSWELLTSLSGKLEGINHPFFADYQPENGTVTSGKTLLVLITSNGSLCGGYNSQVIKKAVLKLRELELASPTAEVDIIAVGKKGDQAMRKTGQNVIATFTELPAVLSLNDIAPLSKLVVDEFKKGIYDHVYVAYTDFISALSQKPNIRALLPISKEDIREIVAEVLPPLTKGRTEEGSDPLPTSPESAGKGESEIPYLVEGDMNTLIESLASKLVRMQIYQMLLESGASEQSARMVAMKNASEAAGEMISDLTLVFNKARQAGITQEISEISAGMASLS